MQFIIDSVLTPLITEERKDVILSCVASLESLDYQAALDELHQVVEFNDTMGDSSMLVSRIDDIIWNAHETIFKRHELVVSAEATQEVRQSIVDVLSNFDKYIIPDQLLQLFDGERMPEEIIAHMCQLFTSVKEDEVWPEIRSVSPQLMESIRDIVEQQVRYRGLEDADESPIDRVRMVNDYVRTFGVEAFSMMLDLSRNGVRVGNRDIGSLLQQSLEALDRKPVEHAVMEMFGLLLLSSTPIEEIPKKIRDLIGDFTDNNIDNTLMNKTIKPFLDMLDGYRINESS